MREITEFAFTLGNMAGQLNAIMSNQEMYEFFETSGVTMVDLKEFQRQMIKVSEAFYRERYPTQTKD